MNENLAKTLFSLYVFIHRRKNSSLPQEQAKLVEERRKILKMLREGGYKIKAFLPPTPHPETQVKIILVKNIDEQNPLAEETIIIKFFEERLQQIKEAESSSRFFSNLEEATRHFHRFVEIFRQSIEGNISSLAEKNALLEKQKLALEELNRLDGAIHLHCVLNYQAAAAEDKIAVTLFFILLPLQHRNKTPVAVEKVTLQLSSEESRYLLGSYTIRESDNLISEEETRNLLRDILGKDY